MSSLFIAGNGFDIAHEIPTKYSNFRLFVINIYPESLDLRDDVINLNILRSKSLFLSIILI